MNERDGSKFSVQSRAFLSLTFGAVGPAGTVLVLLVALVVHLPSRVCRQSGGGGNPAKQNLSVESASRVQRNSAKERQEVAKNDQSELFPNDNQAKMPISENPRGFFNSRDLLPNSVRNRASNIQRRR